MSNEYCTCEASGSETGKLSQRLGCQSRALPNAKRATSTVPAGGLALTAGAPAAPALENQPVTAHGEPRLVHSYNTIFHGFAALLTEEELEAASRKPGFGHWFPNGMMYPAVE